MNFLGALAIADAAVASALGEPVVYTPSVGVPVTVTGIFDTLYERVDASNGLPGVASAGPAVFLRLSDLPSDPSSENPSLTIRGTVYAIHEMQPDGTGNVVLLLHRAT